MQILMQNLSENKFTSQNFVRSSQDSSNVNSLVINTNDATKWKKWWNLKIEQTGTNQTSNVEDEEIDDDNIPLNKIYKHCHTIKIKHWRNQKKRFHSKALYYIT